MTGYYPRRAILLGLASSLAAYHRSPAQQQKAPAALEPYLLLPEPRAMRTKISLSLENARRTTFTPARQTADTTGIASYSPEEFAKLGISPQSFLAKAQARAEQRLAKLVPEFIKDEQGNTRYAVFRSPSPLICTLLIAPSLAKQVTPLFGTAVWAATPDRHSLYLFPAKPEVIQEFAADLADRYEATAHAASPEFFLLQQGQQPSGIATFIAEP